MINNNLQEKSSKHSVTSFLSVTWENCKKRFRIKENPVPNDEPYGTYKLPKGYPNYTSSKEKLSLVRSPRISNHTFSSDQRDLESTHSYNTVIIGKASDYFDKYKDRRLNFTLLYNTMSSNSPSPSYYYDKYCDDIPDNDPQNKIKAQRSKEAERVRHRSDSGPNKTAPNRECECTHPNVKCKHIKCPTSGKEYEVYERVDDDKKERKHRKKKKEKCKCKCECKCKCKKKKYTCQCCIKRVSSDSCPRCLDYHDQICQRRLVYNNDGKSVYSERSDNKSRQYCPHVADTVPCEYQGDQRCRCTYCYPVSKEPKEKKKEHIQEKPSVHECKCGGKVRVHEHVPITNSNTIVYPNSESSKTAFNCKETLESVRMMIKMESRQNYRNITNILNELKKQRRDIEDLKKLYLKTYNDQKNSSQAYAMYEQIMNARDKSPRPDPDTAKNNKSNLNENRRGTKVAENLDSKQREKNSSPYKRRPDLQKNE